MADIKTGGVGFFAGAALGLAIGATALSTDKTEALSDITVNEAIASKSDSTTQILARADMVRDGGRETVYDIKPAVVDEDGKIVTPAETLSVKEVEIPRTVVRPEGTMRFAGIARGDTVRVVAFVGEKTVGQWVAVIEEPADLSKDTRLSVQATLYDQVK